MDLSLNDPELGPELKIQYQSAGGDPLKAASPITALYSEAGTLIGSDDKKLTNTAQISRFKAFVTKVETLQKSAKSTEERLELEALSEWAHSKIHSLTNAKGP
jgi:hypothetical protein